MTDCTSSAFAPDSSPQESADATTTKNTWRKIRGDVAVSGEVRLLINPAASLIASHLVPLQSEIERRLADARVELESERSSERSQQETELLRDLVLGLVDIKDVLDWMVPEFQPYSGLGGWVEARMMILGYDRETLAAACDTTEATISRTLAGATVPKKPLLDSLVRACMLAGETEDEARATLPKELQ